MTRWKRYRERRLRKEKALELLTLSCTVRPAGIEPRYLGRDRAVRGHHVESVWHRLWKLYTCKTESSLPPDGSDKSSLDAALTEPDEACCAVGLEELRAYSHQRSDTSIPFALPNSHPSSLRRPNVDDHELDMGMRVFGMTDSSLRNRWKLTCVRVRSLLLHI